MLSSVDGFRLDVDGAAERLAHSLRQRLARGWRTQRHLKEASCRPQPQRPGLSDGGRLGERSHCVDQVKEIGDRADLHDQRTARRQYPVAAGGELARASQSGELRSQGKRGAGGGEGDAYQEPR